MTAGCVVVKLGGSLLDLPDVGERLERFLESRRDQRAFLIVGGGPAADLVRAWDQRHHLGDEAAHWLAVRTLSLTAHLMASLLSSAQVVTSLEACPSVWDEGALPLLDPYEFLVADDLGSAALPHTWDVTSDSIAARVAEATGAGELILLKSSAPQEPISLSEASRLGFVDRFFPRAARTLPKVILLNLRDPVGGPVTLQRN